MAGSNPMTDNEAYFMEQLALIEQSHKAIKADLAFIKEHIVKADATISLVAEQVMPTIDELMKSPMLKMLGVGKKK
jgi:hypothetical protein